jgi:hypothetical protein
MGRQERPTCSVRATSACHRIPPPCRIHFKVKDFNAWQTSYNGNEKNRTSAGITKSKVFRSSDDPNDVLLLQDVADVSKARTWYGSSEMKSLMEKSGVVGSPSIRSAA